MPTTLPGLIPLQDTVRITFNDPCGNGPSRFKKPWSQLLASSPWQYSLSHWAHRSPLLTRNLSGPLSSRSLCFSSWAAHVLPLHVPGHLTRQPALRMPLCLCHPLPSSFLGGPLSHVHRFLKAWLLHSNSILCYLVY